MANQPWKNPHGENQSERRDFYYFISNVQDRKLVEKFNLSPPANFISKSGKCAQQTQPYTLLFFLNLMQPYNPEKRTSRIIKSTVQQQNRPYLPRNSCPELADRTAGRTSISVLKFIVVRTAFNAGRTHPQNLDFCAENLMQTVQHLMSRTIPQFLCNQCSRTAFNEAVLFLELCA